MAALLFLGAGVAFKASVLLGGSSHVFMVGAVCLFLSLDLLLVLRLRARSRRRADAGVAAAPRHEARR
ncbi:hypothetical protein [Nannocystis pusilla]|uniref:Uncharacterized protein n=1 Tax=Nannocystis pusilla TaxID=889268 RepID=A0ABS7TKT5_9BACT|nr:hypothetical protein [Nannocystis pusilla]MBZ5708821.1 hypothetical protein [Nannocystis pusilla]